MDRLKKIDTIGIRKLQKWIDETPEATQADIAEYARRMGYDSADLLPTTLGATLLEKRNQKLSTPFSELLQNIFSDDLTPGGRFVIDPDNVKTKEGVKIAERFKKNPGLQGFAEYGTIKMNGKEIRIPTRTIVKEPTSGNPFEILKQIGVQGHEFPHSENIILSNKSFPHREFIENFEKLGKRAPIAGQPGHHFGKSGDIIEAKLLQQLIRDLYDPEINQIEAGRRELSKKLNELNLDKYSEKDRSYLDSLRTGLKINPNFKKLMAVLGPAGALMSAGSDASEGKYGTAALKALSAFDPTGLSDAAVDINERLNMSPEELKQQLREDKYKAMPIGLDSPADIMLDQLEDELDIQKEREKQKRKLGYK